jgi:hypothetical protein
MQNALKQTFRQNGIILLLILLFCVTIFNFWHQSKNYTEVIIAEDIALLSALFKKINDDVGIVDFRYPQQNYIDFLNVISFEGSEIGTMIVHNPKKWKGPYVRDNPLVQGKYYQVVKTKYGYYITPGDGVRLSNGKVIGKDIVIDKNSDIEKMVHDPHLLQFKGRNLATKIELSQEKSTIPMNDFLTED